MLVTAISKLQTNTSMNTYLLLAQEELSNVSPSAASSEKEAMAAATTNFNASSPKLPPQTVGYQSSASFDSVYHTD
jgi:hypothetical protein